jgi:hypothetical protein
MSGDFKINDQNELELTVEYGIERLRKRLWYIDHSWLSAAQKLNNPQKIVIGKQQYKIESGWLNLEVSQGKMLQFPFGIRWTYNSWISGNGHEVQTGAITVGDSLVGEKAIEWWRSLIRETVNGGVAID